jgi:3-deoxy-D-manno-octulosonate 8-phosphate phosphatase (KDO 8-P phosphatase)
MDPGTARRIRLVILDVDGVLTDGGVYVGAGSGGEGIELKRFDVRDGLGIKMLLWAGLEVAFVSGRVSEATARRAEELGVTECHQDGGAQKLPVARDLMARKGVDWPEVAMVADDLADLPVFRRVGLPVAVANASEEVLSVASWCTTKPGGHGAVREFCRALLMARDQWTGLLETYLGDRSD